jgi:hypothetical protein
MYLTPSVPYTPGLDEQSRAYIIQERGEGDIGGNAETTDVVCDIFQLAT